MMAARTLGSSHVAKLVEDVGRKFVTCKYLIVLSSARCGYARCAINEKDEYEARVRKEDREIETIKDRYLEELEFVNAERKLILNYGLSRRLFCTKATPESSLEKLAMARLQASQSLYQAEESLTFLRKSIRDIAIMMALVKKAMTLDDPALILEEVKKLNAHSER